LHVDSQDNVLVLQSQLHIVLACCSIGATRLGLIPMCTRPFSRLNDKLLRIVVLLLDVPLCSCTVIEDLDLVRGSGCSCPWLGPIMSSRSAFFLMFHRERFLYWCQLTGKFSRCSHHVLDPTFKPRSNIIHELHPLLRSTPLQPIP
jgi:hypothetical protein